MGRKSGEGCEEKKKRRRDGEEEGNKGLEDGGQAYLTLSAFSCHD
jgi:hypothetical protein